MTSPSDEDLPNKAAMHRFPVVVALPFDQSFDYLFPDDIGAGSVVEVPFRGRQVWGVVWDKAIYPQNDENDGSVKKSFDHHRLKVITTVAEIPPLEPCFMNFSLQLAHYYMMPLGWVIKSNLSGKGMVESKNHVKLLKVSPIKPKAKLSAKRAEIIYYLQAKGEVSFQHLLDNIKTTRATINNMIKAGELDMRMKAQEVRYEQPQLNGEAVAFSQTQQEAIELLTKQIKKQKFSPIILDGETGSGKTDVYFEAIAETLKIGKTCLILLPEIALSKQWITRFKRRFKVQPAVWHSNITVVQRQKLARAIALGNIHVVVGARSALLLGMRSIGLIIVDEEHEQSYKQEDGLIYHARDMAILRGYTHACPVILASATPSLETLRNIKQKSYLHVQLEGLPQERRVSKINVINLLSETPERGRWIAPLLVTEMAKTLERQEQVFLFLNRKGYAPLMLCQKCGHRFACQSCSAWLVQHIRRGRYQNAPHLQCHHCGHQEKLPEQCPSCSSPDHLNACGPGIERLEEEVLALFPGKRIATIASDSFSTAQEWDDFIERMTRGDVDILIATQIMAKGHHFPKLTLIGAIDADIGLQGGDPRAGEKTYQLLHQLAGRAGREELPGEVYIQTNYPESGLIKALSERNRDQFMAYEQSQRQQTGMPPYGHLAALIISSHDEKMLNHFAKQLAYSIPKNASEAAQTFRILGPAPAPIYQLRGKYRLRFLVVCQEGLRPQAIIKRWLKPHKTPGTIRVQIDIDPYSFF